MIGISFNQHTNASTRIHARTAHKKSLLENWYPEKWLFKTHLPFNTRRKAESYFFLSFLQQYLSFILIDGPIIILSKWKGTVFICVVDLYLIFCYCFPRWKHFLHTRFALHTVQADCGGVRFMTSGKTVTFVNLGELKQRWNIRHPKNNK